MCLNCNKNNNDKNISVNKKLVQCKNWNMICLIEVWHFLGHRFIKNQRQYRLNSVGLIYQTCVGFSANLNVWKTWKDKCVIHKKSKRASQSQHATWWVLIAAVAENDWQPSASGSEGSPTTGKTWRECLVAVFRPLSDGVRARVLEGYGFRK